jgi:predicted MFS family arabinose efflux permease
MPEALKAESPRSTQSLAQPASSTYVWYVVILLATVNLINYVDRMALAVLAPLIKADLNLSDSQLGLLTGFAFALFYAVCGIPIAQWADRTSRRNIITLALTAWSVMTALSGAAQHFWHLLLTRIGVAAGEAGSWAPGTALLCDYVPVNRRAGILSIFAFGNNAGILVGMTAAGWLGATIGWRWTFLALAIPGMLLAAVVRLTLREPTRGQFDAKPDNVDRSFGETMRLLWRCRTYRFLVFWFVANGFVQTGFSQWWPSFYARSFTTELSMIGMYLGVAYGAGVGTGVLLGGALANRIAQRGLKRPLLVGAAATASSLPAAVGSLFVPTVEMSIGLVLLTSLLWGMSIGPVVAAQASAVPPQVRSTAGGVNIFFTSVVGFGLGPFLVGVLSDLLAPSLGVQALRYALLMPSLVIPAMVLALCGAARAVREA